MSDNEKKLTGKRVLLYFTIFFGIVIIVNVFFVKVALRTNPGVEVEHTYEKEMKFEKSQNSVKDE